MNATSEYAIFSSFSNGYVPNAQVFHPRISGRRVPPGHDRYLQAAANGQDNEKAVGDIELLHLETIGAKVNRIIGQHTIDIQRQQLDCLETVNEL
jgi:hypothetical protein